MPPFLTGSNAMRIVRQCWILSSFYIRHLNIIIQVSTFTDHLATFETFLLFRKHRLRYIQGTDIAKDLSRNLLNIYREVGGYKKAQTVLLYMRRYANSTSA